VRPGDVASVQAAADAIRAAVCAAPVPDEVRAEIAAAYAALAHDASGDDPEPPVAVRSSAVGEDSGEATFAGQQETYLWVRGADAVCDAVRDCWASTYSAPAMTYRARMAADRAPEMGVAVQLMVDASVSGVMFTCNPVTGDPSVVAVNASWGLGLGVVGGDVTPDEYLVSKVTGEVVRRTVSTKHVEYRPDASGRGTVCVPVAEERQGAACLGEDDLAGLVDVARRVQKHFGSHQDVEFVLGPGGDGLFVVQSRPVTVAGAATTGESEAVPASALSMVMSKFGAGGGGG
jgi:pyruvate,water dikinase